MHEPATMFTIGVFASGVTSGILVGIVLALIWIQKNDDDDLPPDNQAGVDHASQQPPKKHHRTMWG